MNTILILGNNSTEGKSLVVLLQQWENSVEVITAPDENSASKLLAAQSINLIICNLNLADQNGLKVLLRITSAHPYIPCIAITNTVREALRYGASYCLQSPFDTVKFLSQISEFLELETRGSIKGIPIHSFLQMLEGENKTCTLNISTATEMGYLYVRNGELIGGETTDLKGEDAIYEILVWEDVTIEIKFLNPRLKQDIDKPLIYYIMEAFRKKDEKNLHPEVLPQRLNDSKLQHILTTRTPLSLDIGAQLKMEYTSSSSPVVSTMVGMLPNKHLITTCPVPSKSIQKAQTHQERVTIRYIHMGRLCMFKTTILKIIESPENLLFLDYPAVVHYREMRRSQRVSTHIQAKLTSKDGFAFQGILKELSTTGCLYHIKTRGNESLSDVDILEEITLQFNVKEQLENQEVPGIVKNMQKNSYEINLGILFQEPLTLLSDYLEELSGDVKRV